MYKVLLVDDETLIREAISENIQWEEIGFSFMGACENGKQAMEAIEKEQPDLLLTDINMPFVDGMELTKFVYENYPDTKVIIISGFDEFEYAKNAVKYQVLEYILKPITPMEFTETLLRVKKMFDERKESQRDMKKIRSAYVSNLPMVQGRYLHNLLNPLEAGSILSSAPWRDPPAWGTEMQAESRGQALHVLVEAGDLLMTWLESEREELRKSSS